MTPVSACRAADAVRRGLDPVPMPVPPSAAKRRALKYLRPLLPVVIVAAVFGFLLPRLGSYDSAWAGLTSMSWRQTVLVAAVAALNLSVSWGMIVSLVPSLRLREAAVLNLGPTAVANTVPAGEAAALGMSWTMLSSWGIGTGEYVRYTLVSGIFNVLAKLALPVFALGILALTGEPTAGLAAGAVAALILLLCGGAGLFVVLRGDPRHARHLVRALEWLVGGAYRLARRPPPGPMGPALTDFRRDTRALLAARGKRIALATAATHLSLALVLITCLHAGGVTQAQVSWQTALAAFAFVRLLSALPVTPVASASSNSP